MAFSFKDVGDAIATRFSSANITPPAGATNVRVSTTSLPNAIAVEPTVLVYPPTVPFRYGTGVRKATASYPVRFYIYRVRDDGRNAALILDWMDALYAQMSGQLQLGLSGYVLKATVSEMSPGALTYGDGDAAADYHGIELNVDVEMWEAENASA